jgi:fructose-1,6-bisphosphatase/inositol monophosphatase family enzyme
MQRARFSLERARDQLLALQTAIQQAIMADLRERQSEALAQVAAQRGGDTIYAIDARVEEVLLDFCREWAKEQPFVLVAEGVGEGEEEGRIVFPAGATEEQAAFTLIVDPIDGTRGIMYDKRSAWSLAGVAPTRTEPLNLSDIVVAAQTELPISKQYLADQLWAIRGQGVGAERHNLLTGERTPFAPHPSQASDLNHGFAMLAEFFPGRRAITSEIQDRLAGELGEFARSDRVRIFNDQYISTGGQLYELIVGHDRFDGDIRAHLMRAAHLPGNPPGLAAHPYDICTELIAREAGVIVTALDGGPLRNPLAVDDNVSWLGYANSALHRLVAPILSRLLAEYGLI